MFNYIKITEHGLIIGSCSMALATEDSTLIQTSESMNACVGTHWFDGGAIVPLPERPSEQCIWQGGMSLTHWPYKRY
jgi:hypothetical protein